MQPATLVDAPVFQRRQNLQTISWFYDLHQRGLLELDPPYQRRSVWNQAYKDAFIDTVLLGYPAPAVFLYEDIQPTGRALYNVVDGKQRLLTILEFVQDHFPVPAESKVGALRDRYFRDFPDDRKRLFWSYPFLVEYLPTNAESVINEIFDRINKNVAKLTAQELRHARFSGVFISACEQLAEWLEGESRDFPRILEQSRRQMKDVQFVAELLLLIEKGPRSWSQDELDEAFATRDQQWEERDAVDREFRAAVAHAKALVAADESLRASRMRNQVDFYALIGAIVDLTRAGRLAAAGETGPRLAAFTRQIDDAEARQASEDAQRYYEAARSAASDTSNRRARIDLLQKILR